MESKHEIRLDKIMSKIVPWYLENIQHELDAAVAAAQAGRWEEVERVGHNMKGTGGSYGFDEITRVGRSIESLGAVRQEQNLQEIVQELRQYLANLRITYE